MTPSRFHLHSVSVVPTYGAVPTRCYVVIRKVPDGYSAPSVTISNVLGSIPDPMNVLARAIIPVTGTGLLPIKLQPLNSTMVLQPNDTIIAQVVSDTSSASQRIDIFGEYSLTAV
jgi:hypothetical protein